MTYLATRVRKARSETACALCGHLIRRGTQIGHITGKGWAHVDPCILAAQKGAAHRAADAS